MNFLKIINNKKLLAGLLSAFLLIIFILPVFVSAGDPDDGVGKGIVRCGNTVKDGKFVNSCDFIDFIALINDIINWIIGMAGVIFTISAIWGGFLYMTSGTSVGSKEKAIKILTTTMYGFILLLVGWLIVYTILDFLVPKEEGANSIFQFLGGRK